MPPEFTSFITWFTEDADLAHYFLASAIVLMILSGKLHGKFFGWTIGGGANGKKAAAAAPPAITKDDLREMEGRLCGKLEDLRREFKEDLRQHDDKNHSDFADAREDIKELRRDIKSLWAARQSDNK